MKTKLNFKSFISGLLAGAILMSVSVPIFAKSQTISAFFNDIKIKVNGKQISIPEGETPFIYNGRTFVPAKYIAENLNATVKWNETDNTVEIQSKESVSADGTASTQGGSDSVSTNNSTTTITQTPDGITQIDTFEGKQYIGFIYIRNKIKEKGYNFSIDAETRTWQISKDKKVILDNVPTLIIYGANSVELNYYIDTILPLIK